MWNWRRLGEHCHWMSSLILISLGITLPPSVTNTIEEGYQNDAAKILVVVPILRVNHTVPNISIYVVTGYGEIKYAQTLLTYLNTQDVFYDWINARYILVFKSEFLGTGLGEKG